MTTPQDFITIRSVLPDAPRQGVGRNRLLGALPARDAERILTLLEPVPLPEAMSIHEPDVPITDVYFLCTGVVSVVSEMDEGTVEVGVVGCEGMTGIRYALALFEQAAQHAACNRLHALEERCARWLLMTHDTRGKVTVLDRPALEGAACGCYRIIVRRAEELLSGRP